MKKKEARSLNIDLDSILNKPFDISQNKYLKERYYNHEIGFRRLHNRKNFSKQIRYLNYSPNLSIEKSLKSTNENNLGPKIISIKTNNKEVILQTSVTNKKDDTKTKFERSILFDKLGASLIKKRSTSLKKQISYDDNAAGLSVSSEGAKFYYWQKSLKRKTPSSSNHEENKKCVNEKRNNVMQINKDHVKNTCILPYFRIIIKNHHK